MTLLDDLRAQLRHFDDAALEAIGNKGLLRRARKDLEKASPTLGACDDAVVTVQVGEHAVRFDARGPAHASCSCPATGTCQHLLAAVLGLQQLGAAAVAGDASSCDTSAAAQSAAAPDLHAALLAFDAEQLTRHAGLTGHRWAAQFVLDLDLERDVQLSGTDTPTISFRRPRLVARCTGAALDNIVLDGKLPQPQKYRVAAVLAYQRAHGAEVVVPGKRGERSAPRLDLGDEHVPAATAATTRDAARQRLRGAFLALAGECVQLGLSHLSEHVQQRFATMAVSAQGADYHRLARLLRRIADHVELLLARTAGADEHRLFDELALATALVTALDRAAAAGHEPAALLGAARSRYEELGQLQLFGLGAHAFRSAGGISGLTMLLIDPRDGSMVACTDARPATVRGFEPLTRYRQPGPWTGLGAPQLLTGRQVALRAAHANERGQLSAAERTQATLLPADAPLPPLQAIERWQDLPSPQRSLLAEPQPMRDWVLLQPTRFDAGVFDPVRQALRWPLIDGDGAVLDAQLRWSPLTRHAIERIEALTADDLPPGTKLVARLMRSDGERLAEPLSLLRPSAVTDAPPSVDALHFDPPPRATTGPARQRDAVATPADSPDGPDDAALPEALRTLRSWLQARAERGVPATSDAPLRLELLRRLAAARDAGCTAFAGAATAATPTAALLLRADYVCLCYAQALGATAPGPLG